MLQRSKGRVLLNEIKAQGMVPHPTKLGVFVSQKFLDDVVAAAVEGTADAVDMILGYGTSEGADKGWDTRGRGRKAILDNPPKKFIPLGQTTEEAWKDPKTGEWDAKREEWHQAFAEREIAGKTPVQGRPPIAIIMGGGTASGKSTLARKIAGDDPNMVHVDADGIKPRIPEHEELRKAEGDQPTATATRNPNLASSREHEESSYIAKLTMAKAAANGLDVLYDATSSGKGLAIMINKMASEGYDVHLLFADVPEHIAAARAESRAANPNDPAGFGRHIPEEAMHNTHVLSAANYILMKDSSMLKSARAYDTTEREPALMHSKGIGFKGEDLGPGKIHDDSKWEYYTRKAAGGQ